MELKNLEYLPSVVRSRIKRYLEGLLFLHKENIISIFVYGPVVEKDFSHKKPEINPVRDPTNLSNNIIGSNGVNLGVVFRQLSFRQLKESLYQIRAGIKKGIPAPLFLTLEHIKSSLDVFPLEFFQMQDNHILFYGEDLLSSIQINDEHLRLEVEEQIKGKLIHIRQAYLEMGLEKKGIDVLLKGSLNSLIPTFRGVLKVAEFDKVPPKDKFEIVKTLCEKFNLDKEVFISILRDEKDDHTILGKPRPFLHCSYSAQQKGRGKDAEEYLARYIEELQKLAEIADTIL